ncbi:MAG: alpha,6-mannosyltransferase [Acidimicrobiaceae bacterium]
MALEVAPSAPTEQRRALAGPYMWIGLAGSVLIAITAPLWRLSGPTWRLTVPGVPHNGERPVTAIAFVLGVSMLGLAWMGLIARVERSHLPERARMRAVLVCAVMWFAPLLLGPPLLSSDLYSYAAEGAMVTQGLDPTVDGMYKLHYGDYVARTDPVWRGSFEDKSYGNPYGPVQMGATAAVVDLSGHDVDLTLWGLRLLAIASVFASVWGIWEIARHHGVDPPTAVAIGIANPITVLHLVGGAHNDAFLMAFLVTGCAFALRRRWVLGVAFIALAMGVKLPAAAAIVYLGWQRVGASAAIRERVRSAGRALAGAFAITLALCALIGISLIGWIQSMQNSGRTMGTLSVTTRVGYVVSSLFRAVGLPSHDSTWIAFFRLGGLAAAGALCLWMLARADRIGAIQATAIAMMAVVLLGPVVWPWYLAPAIALLGAAGIGRWRPALIVLTVAFSFEVFPVGPNSKPVLEGSHFVSLGFILLIVVLTAIAPFVVEWWRGLDDEELPGSDPLPFAPAD